MLSLPDSWVWDFWFADDGERYHLFFLRASRALLDRDRRHRHASLGHAVSPDLRTWTAHRPLTTPGAGFEHLEVPQLEVVDGRPLLLFSCLHAELGPGRRAVEPTGGIWMAAGPRGSGAFGAFAHVGDARLLSDDRLYVGRMIRDRDGEWALLAFHNRGPDGRFVGAISDPVPLLQLVEQRF